MLFRGLGRHVPSPTGYFVHIDCIDSIIEYISGLVVLCGVEQGFKYP